MVRSRISKQKHAQLQQQSKESRTAQEKMKPLDDEIHRLIQQPGTAATLRRVIRHNKQQRPISTADTIRIGNAALLKHALIQRWGVDKWEDMIVPSPKPGETNNGKGKSPADKHVAFADGNDSDSSHTLDHEHTVDPDHAFDHMEAEYFGDLLKSPVPSPTKPIPRPVRCGNHLIEGVRQDAEEKLKHEPTLRALGIVLRKYPGESEAVRLQRVGLALDHLRRKKELLDDAQTESIMVATAPRAKFPRLTQVEVNSVQQIWRAMHRQQGTEISAAMRAAVRDFLEQFPEGITMSPASLAFRYGMLPAIVAAIRTANDAELESEKKEKPRCGTPFDRSISAPPKKPNNDYKIWKPTGSAVLITEAKPAEPTTPVHQTGSGANPPTPTAPKKPKSKKPEPKKKPQPKKKPALKKKPEPKKPKSAKPTGIQKATPPTTPTGGRKSTRLIAKAQ
jgi:hypothetical protein